MGTNLVSIIMKFLTPEVIARLASALGLDRAIAQKAITAAIPTILAYLGNAVTKPGGERQLANALAQQPRARSKQSLAKGGGVLTVRVRNEKEAHRAQGLLESLHIVDVDKRAQGFIEERLKEKRSGMEDDVIRLVEEALSVGKRRIETGVTRVRRYVVERPVETQINLKSEQAEVIRKVIENPTLLTDVDWSDKMIEVVESDEEAVVSKTARVAEEVRVRKGESARTETVRDTVRKQQVDVERVATERTQAERTQGERRPK